MTKKDILKNTEYFVKETLRDAEGGHDWFHVERVYKNALHLAKTELVNDFVVALAALLHDIADSKFHDGNDNIGPEKAKQFLLTQQVPLPVIAHVVQIIKHMSYSSGLDGNKAFNSAELQVVQDADRLDALGAIGIARAFNYGGFKNRPLYNPDIKPNLNMDKAAYRASSAPTINHFYEKLLRLKNSMNTETGKKMAAQRHQFMEAYLEQFYAEWHGQR
ncbi:HD domain-containing protein [Bizionia sediminis]|uniref:HD domain-containing protein n=1 Tax=Bizionia sediminis TaxID=1737064 RepID=A0ABW5KTK6_9FLAO